MPFRFSENATQALATHQRCVEDRRNNPVRNRDTKFRLLQQNMLAYTYPFIPGFAEAGINGLGFDELIEQALTNAREEGRLLYGGDFHVEGNAVSKVAGDVFEEVEAAIHWNTAARWNSYMQGNPWPTQPRYPKPSTPPGQGRLVAALSLPRRYDWVRLLDPPAAAEVAALRSELEVHGLTLPTSTPDLLVVCLPDNLTADPRFVSELPSLDLGSQLLLDRAHLDFEGLVAADRFVLGVAFKKSLRSDRLYQPLYEANVMQLILEGRLGAEQVDFEVHTLESTGTRATQTYSAASLGLVATSHAKPHRAVRELYEPPTADALVRRLLAFLDHRAGTAPPPVTP
jgi:hypothetical protein